MASPAPGGLPADTTSAPVVLGVSWTLILITTIVVVLRLFTARIVHRKLSIPDILVVAALILAITCDAMFSVSAHFGLGRHIYYVKPTQLAGVLKFEVMAEPFGMLSPMFARISFATYLLQLVGPWKPKRYTLYTIIVLQILVNVASVILFLSQCGPYLADLWSQVEGSSRCLPRGIAFDYVFFGGAFNTLTDFILTIIPAFIIYHLKVHPSIKAGLSAILGLSLLASVASIIRTYQLGVVIHNPDFTRKLATFVIWYNVENFIVIVAASVPTIRPLCVQARKKREQENMEGSPSATSGNALVAMKHHSRSGSSTLVSTSSRPQILRVDTWDIIKNEHKYDPRPYTPTFQIP